MRLPRTEHRPVELGGHHYHTTADRPNARRHGVAGKHPMYTRAKTIIEFVLAIVFMAVAAPLIVLLAAAVKLTSRGPAFYSQVRLGKDSRPYRIIKLRTMLHNCEGPTGPQWSTSNDPRVTRLGAFLRATHLDELPQLWNVVRGEMSLVGPRPERPEFVAKLEQAIPDYRVRMTVRPGITGLAQVNLPPDTDIDSVRRKLKYDLQYMRRFGLLVDLKLLACSALYLARVPFHKSSKLVRLPDPQMIDHDIYRSTARPEAAPLQWA
jgi:lipopolysaccharide/colanic/teichoic acid biosynthesis glycosyltransferase